MTAASVEAMHHAKAAGAKVIVDADSFSSEMMDNIQNIDVFIGSEFFYNALFRDKDYEKNCRALCGKGPSIVVFTLGAKGCVGYSPEEGYFEMPSFDVPVADTVGAGDGFAAGVISALAEGESLEEATFRGNVIGAIQITHRSDNEGLPTREQLSKIILEGTA